jgi:hypothetical protein
VIHIEDQTQVTDSQQGTTETAETEQVVEQTPSETQQPETQQVEDNFFDPNSVPEELKPAYKQMQAAFTKKTQEIAEARKEAEAIRQKAEQYDKYQQHIPIVEEMLRSKQQAVQSPELLALEKQYREAGYSDEAIEMMKMGIGYALNQFNSTQSQQREADRVLSQISEAAKVDPRLTDASLVYQTEDGDSTTFGQIVEEIVQSDPNWQKDPVAATRRAVKKVDALIGRSKTQGKEELSTMAKSKAARFPQTPSSPQSASDTESKGSIRDIGKQTAAELGIKL